MKKIVGVRFKRLGKIYFFDPQDIKLEKRDQVIVETAQGDEFGEVLIANRYIENEKVKNIQYISSLNVRISHEVLGCADANIMKNARKRKKRHLKCAKRKLKNIN